MASRPPDRTTAPRPDPGDRPASRAHGDGANGDPGHAGHGHGGGHLHGDRPGHRHPPDHDHDHGRGDSHAHAVPAPGAPHRAFLLGITLNLAFVVIEAGAGWWADSLALLSDAGHNLSDVLALALAWAGAWAAQRAPTARFTWGWRRAALLAALINATLLLIALGAIAWEAAHRIAEPVPVDSRIVIAVAALGIVINGLTALLFLRGQHTDLNLRGAFLHMVADAAVSAAVVAGGLAVLYTGWDRLDPLISLGIVLLVGASAIPLARQSIALSMDAVPAGIDPARVRALLLALPGVASLHDLHVWPLGTSGVALSAHLVMPGGHPGDRFLADARDRLRHTFAIEHVTLQVEVGPGPCAQDCDPNRQADTGSR